MPHLEKDLHYHFYCTSALAGSLRANGVLKNQVWHQVLSKLGPNIFIALILKAFRYALNSFTL